MGNGEWDKWDQSVIKWGHKINGVRVKYLPLYASRTISMLSF
jgi:hypothetical protein